MCKLVMRERETHTSSIIFQTVNAAIRASKIASKKGVDSQIAKMPRLIVRIV